LITDLLGCTGPLPPLRDGTVILDCGCGTGNLCQAIAEQLPAATLLAVEKDAAMAQHFRRKLADRLSLVPTPGRICLLEADLKTVPAWLIKHDLRPDYVFFVNVLYLLEDPEAALRATAGWLCPHGELRLSNPDERTDLDALFSQLERDLVDTQQINDLINDFATLRNFNRQRLSLKLHRLSCAETCRLVLESGFRRIAHITHEHYAGQSLLLSAEV
jgi:SAM-dependent methyltransferase